MTIAEAQEKCKVLIAKVPRDMLIIAILMLASSASFWLGYLAAPLPEVACPLSQIPEREGNVLNETETSATRRFVASKNGTKYYPLDCAGANRISDANKIWFASAEAARTAGYAPAANCPGL